MPRKLKATVRYDGTNFSGWQVQPGQHTVQGALEEALATIAGQPVRVIGAGRTDAGVHAMAQVFHFEWEGAQVSDTLIRSLSKMLGPEIRIESMEEAPETFHAIADATAKRYAYVISNAPHPDPFADRYAWIRSDQIDQSRFTELAQRLVGEHDFAGFCSSGSSAKTTVREIYSIRVIPGPVVGPNDSDAFWRAEFSGNGFLYKMIRNITGTLIDIACGKVSEERIDERLDSPGPYMGYTAPAKGLFLMEVSY
jgi:tRNA pseudouridine38-40 synthase